MHKFEKRQIVLAYHDFPEGSHISGAAYGEYLKKKGLMVAIGVIASVITVGAAAPAFAAAMAAGNVGAALATGAMMAGGVMSGLGAVTGNAKLTKLGGVLALAGGAGSLLTGAFGATGAAADAAKGAVSSPVTQGVAEGTALAGVESSSAAEAAAQAGVAAGKTADAATLTVGTVADGAVPVQQGVLANEVAPMAAASAPAPPISDVIAQNNPSAVIGKAGSSKGLLESAWGSLKDFSGTKLGEQVISGAVKGVGESLLNQGDNDIKNDYYSAKTNEANVTTGILSAKAAAPNNIPIVLNPADPNYAQQKAAAAAAGRLTVDLTVAGQAPITRAPVQTQFNAPVAAR